MLFVKKRDNPPKGVMAEFNLGLSLHCPFFPGDNPKPTKSGEMARNP